MSQYEQQRMLIISVPSDGCDAHKLDLEQFSYNRPNICEFWTPYIILLFPTSNIKYFELNDKKHFSRQKSLYIFYKLSPK